MRSWLWNFSDRQRFPRQPWEGLMRDSSALQVKTADGELVRGFLYEYSRAQRPRQLRLISPEWLGPEGWIKADESDVLLLEDDIERITVLTVDESESANSSDNE